MKIINNTTEKLADDLRVTIKKRSRVSMICTQNSGHMKN